MAKIIAVTLIEVAFLGAICFVAFRGALQHPWMFFALAAVGGLSAGAATVWLSNGGCWGGRNE